MRKLVLVTSAVILGSLVGLSSAQAAPVNDLNEPGSLLVYPLIDNITGGNSTIVEVVNGGTSAAVLECNMVTHGDVDPTIDEKQDFFIKLSPKEKFWWDTSLSYNRTNNDGNLVQLSTYNNRKGYMFCWAVDNDIQALEIQYDYLRGEAIVYTNTKAFGYSAIPSKRLQANVAGFVPGNAINNSPANAAAVLAAGHDRVLNLDGIEYTQATSKIMFEGLAAGTVPGLNGTLVVANIGINFQLSTQQEFVINADCWNQDETKSSRQVDFKDFAQYPMNGAFDMQLGTIFTPGFNCEVTATGSDGMVPPNVVPKALWAVYFTEVGPNLAAGVNVWQDPGAAATTTVTLSSQ